MKITASGFTEKGQRQGDQDALLINDFVSSPERFDNQGYEETTELDPEKLYVFCVCDGVGSLSDSGKASRIILEAIREQAVLFNEGTNKIALEGWAEQAVQKAKDQLIRCCENNGLHGSCTLTLLAILNDRFELINIGHTPAYSIDNRERLKELSIRHNLYTINKSLGYEASETDKSVLKNLIMENKLTFSKSEGNLSNGGFLICSDGIGNSFSERKLRSLLRRGKTVSEISGQAAAKPGSDNCSLILIRFSE